MATEAEKTKTFPLPYRALRMLQGIDQATVAEALEVTQPVYSQMERGQRPISPSQRATLAPILALGERQAAEPDPRYALALVPGTPRIEVLFRPDGRLGLFQRSDAARVAGQLLRRVGRVPIWDVPLWLEYAVQTLSRRRGPEIDETDIVMVDAASDNLEQAQATTQHMTYLLQALEIERQQDRRAAEVAADMIKQTKEGRKK
jgi:transcriptional regulator with XRE-family HTH domain